MNSRIVTDPRPEILSSWMVDGLYITWNRLVSILGEPNSDGDGYKVDGEWEFLFDGEKCSIWNYKNGPNYFGEGAVEDIDYFSMWSEDENIVAEFKKFIGA